MACSGLLSASLLMVMALAACNGRRVNRVSAAQNRFGRSALLQRRTPSAPVRMQWANPPIPAPCTIAHLEALTTAGAMAETADAAAAAVLADLPQATTAVPSGQQAHMR